MRFNPVSRRLFLRSASAAGLAGAIEHTPAHGAPTAGGDDRDRAETATVTYRAVTGGSVTASPAGDLLIAEVQGILWRIPERGGEALRLTEWELEPTRPAISPDGSAVALCAYAGGGFHLWTMRPDGTGLRQLTDGPWDDRGVAWSPDGTRLAFSSDRGGDPVAGSSCGIWTLRLADGRLDRLTGDGAPGGPFEDYDPTWTPDGRHVVFVRAARTPDGGNDGGRSLARVPASGGEAVVIRTVAEGRVLCPSVSPAGRVAHLHLTGTSSSASRPPAAAVTVVVDGRPVVSGEDVAAAPVSWIGEDRLLHLGDGRIRIRALASGTVTEIPFTARLPLPSPARRRKRREPDSTAPAPVRGVDTPVLAPDGRRVAFAALNALWLLAPGAAPRRLVRAAPAQYVQMPSWAPDGRSVVYCSDRDGLTAVYRHDLDGGTDTLLAGGEGRFSPALSPDGTRLACLDSFGKLLVHDLATGTHRVLAEPLGGGGLPGAPSWSPDGRRVAFCDRNRLNGRFREGYNLIRVIDTVTGADTRHLAADHQSLSDRCSSGPVWSPDGRWMALVVESALWLLPVSATGGPTGPPRRLTDEPADHPSWSADSRALLYLSNGRLRLTGPDGTGTRTVPVRLSARRGAPPRGDIVRIHAGQLWDGVADRPRQDVDILLAGNRVTGVEPHRPRRRGHRTVDASDRTVLPGLFDSHVHPRPAPYGGRQNLLALAYGITTTASMGGPAYASVRMREALATGQALGPRLLACTEFIDGSRVAYSEDRAHTTGAGVRRSLERVTALDADFVKTYVRAPGRIMAEAARTAHRLGVPSGSHLCSPGRNAGQDLTTHLQATQRLEHGHATSLLGRIHQDVFAQYGAGAFALIATPFTALPLLGADPRLAEDPRVTALMPPWDTALVRETAGTAPTPRQLEMLAAEAAGYREAVSRGVVLALGTDAPLVPVGLHLHLALRALRAHGFTADQVLRTVTTVPARLFGLDEDLGTVEPGKIADLTVVDGDPFTDFASLVSTSMVVVGGVPHRQGDLVAAVPRDRGSREPGGPPGHAYWLAYGRALRGDSCCGDPSED
ncbi:amidohydrolase family protein [Streptomyces sp. NPDC050856]|uniref:amidohydrolase family protein n=1 Tax=Streptomyces sp. NPDC050856 TaxID=3154939 RepID=UPI0033F012E2